MEKLFELCELIFIMDAMVHFAIINKRVVPKIDMPNTATMLELKEWIAEVMMQL